MNEIEASDVTLVEVLEELRQAGFNGDFRIDDDGQLWCGDCGGCQPTGSVKPDHWRRLEGASDPGDMAAVVALGCPACDQRGSVVIRYGPEAGPGDAAFLIALDSSPSVEDGSRG